MTNINDIKQGILLLNFFPECVAWQDFGDKGNSCSGLYEDGPEEACCLGIVKEIIPKNSPIHKQLSASVAKVLRAEWVTYDWLIKIISRIVAISSLQEFRKMMALSILLKARMAKRGLTQISSIAEVFS